MGQDTAPEKGGVVASPSDVRIDKLVVRNLSRLRARWAVAAGRRARGQPHESSAPPTSRSKRRRIARLTTLTTARPGPRIRRFSPVDFLGRCGSPSYRLPCLSGPLRIPAATGERKGHDLESAGEVAKTDGWTKSHGLTTAGANERPFIPLSGGSLLSRRRWLRCAAEAEALLKQYGRNELEDKGKPKWKLLLEQASALCAGMLCTPQPDPISGVPAPAVACSTRQSAALRG